MEIPYEKIDVEMRPIIRTMNELGIIKTIGCCIGHDKNRSSEVIFKVTDEHSWITIMQNLLKINDELKESNIDFYKWYRLDSSRKLCIDWRMVIEAHPRNLDCREDEEDRLYRIKQQSLEYLIRATKEEIGRESLSQHVNT